VTGSVEFGAQVLLEAFRHGKSAVLMNAEVDATIGPILRVYAREHGAILDIIVDLRPESPTYLEHVAVELTGDNHRALYVPERFAHGYQVLEDRTETSYQVGEFYAPETEGGLLYSDPRLGLEWPLPVAEISPKDAAWPPLAQVGPEVERRMSVTIPAAPAESRTLAAAVAAAPAGMPS